MNKLLTLNINQMTCLQFLTEVEDTTCSDLCNTDFSVWLKGKCDLELCLRPRDIGFDLYYYADHIQQCLYNKKAPKGLEVPFDLGLLWNEHTQNIILAEEAGHPFKSWKWAGSGLLFLENKSQGMNNCMTFLYNDDQCNIILQISAAYPWFFKDAPSPELNISYKDWLPAYKILYKTIIPRKIAQKWVKQLNKLYATLDARMTCCK